MQNIKSQRHLIFCYKQIRGLAKGRGIVKIDCQPKAKPNKQYETGQDGSKKDAGFWLSQTFPQSRFTLGCVDQSSLGLVLPPEAGEASPFPAGETPA